MNICSDVKENTVKWTWDRPLKYVRRKELIVDYPLNIEKVPKHLLNFTFLLAFQDILIWNGGKIEVDELTENEFEGINRIFQRNYESRGCAGQERNHKVPNQPPQIRIKRIATEDLDLSEEVVVCNGFGKDSMNCILIAKELGYTPLLFTMLNQFKTDKLLVDRVQASTEFEMRTNLKSVYSWSNYWEIVNKKCMFDTHTQKTGFYPYAFALIVAAASGRGTILDGIQIHNNKTNILSKAFYCPGESIFHFHDISEATGIRLSSPLRPLSNYGSQRLLAQRWPTYLTHQRSCMRGIPWCCKCAKCQRKALYLEEMGISPRIIGLESFKEHRLGLDHYGPVNNSVAQILSKLRGEPHDDWPWKANSHVFPLIWQGRNIKRIFQEHFDLYSKDPGPDPQGWILEPSKWEMAL